MLPDIDEFRVKILAHRWFFADARTLVAVQRQEIVELLTHLRVDVRTIIVHFRVACPSDEIINTLSDETVD